MSATENNKQPTDDARKADSESLEPTGTARGDSRDSDRRAKDAAQDFCSQRRRRSFDPGVARPIDEPSDVVNVQEGHSAPAGRSSTCPCALAPGPIR